MPLEILPMMLETSEMIVEMSLGTLRAGMRERKFGNIWPFWGILRGSKGGEKSNLGQTKNYASRNTPNDARNIKNDG